MCFGMATTEQKTTDASGTSQQQGATSANSSAGTNRTETGNRVATANPAVQAAALGNLDFARSLQGDGFQGYTGQQVAGLSPGQQGTIDAATGIANNGTGERAGGLIANYASAGPQRVDTSRIADNMSPYMSQYVMQALAPQMHQMDINNARENAGVNAQATGSGAFGDARAGIEAANTRFGQNVAREGVIGNAYNQAFNTAIGAGAQDVSNRMGADTANANFSETALNRALGGANAEQGLQNQQIGVQGAANTLNSQNTANEQARLTAMYNQWLMAQQYPFQTAGLVNSTIGTASSAMPASVATTGNQTGTATSSQTGTASQSGSTTGHSVAETQKPDNSGWALAGTIGGALLGGPVGASIGSSLGNMAGGMFGGGSGGITLGNSGGPTAFS